MLDTFGLDIGEYSLKYLPLLPLILFPQRRNQRMAEDQSVVGRRRIYYDQNGSEALVCSDSEEDTKEPDEEKHEFSQAEDHIIW